MNDERPRAYIPGDVFQRMSQNSRNMWASGTVAHMLIRTGVPVLRVETVPTICYRLNMLTINEALKQLVQGEEDIKVAEPITPNLLQPFVGAAVSGSVFEMLTDPAFIRSLMEQADLEHSLAAVPLLCYRSNLKAQSEVHEKIATGMPIEEVDVPKLFTLSQTQLLAATLGAEGDVLKMDEDAFVRYMTDREALPVFDPLQARKWQDEAMLQADAELNRGE